MKKSRGKKAYYNMIASGAYEIVVLITSLFLPRIILETFGSSDNGLISSITQFLNYISVLTLGVAGPTRVALYHTLSENDDNATSAVLKATEKFYHKVTIAFALYIFALAILYPFFVDSHYSYYEISILVCIIGIGMLGEYCFGITYQALLSADQTLYYYTAIRIISRILDTFVAILLMKKGATIFLVKLGTSIFNTITPLCLYRFAHKKYNIIKNVEPNDIALKQRKHAAASSIANLIHSNTDIILLTLFTSTLTVSVYSVYMLVMNGLIAVMKVFTNALEAPFGKMWARQEISHLTKMLRCYEFIMFSFVAVVFSCTGILVMPFVSLYTNVVSDINYIVPGFAITLTISTAVFCIRQPYLTMVQAAGKYKETKTGSIIEAILNISLSLLLVKPLGLLGVTIGTLAANLFRTIHYSLYTNHTIIIRPSIEVFLRSIWLILTASIIVIVYLFSPFKVVFDSWFSWVVSSVICFFTALFITAVSGLVFYRDDAFSSMRLLLHIIKRA